MKKYFNLLSEKKIKEAEEYRKSLIPKKLIKFIPLTDEDEENKKRFQTLLNRNFWFSRADKLNDPYELKCLYVDRAQLIEKGYPDKLLEFFEDFINNRQTQYAVASLSANDFNYLPMWAYYTNNYSGYCVEYDVIRPDAVYKVSYEPARIKIASIIANFYNEFCKMKAAKKPTSSEVEFYATLIHQQFFMKHESWKHENEFRIVIPTTADVGENIPLESIGLRTSKIVAGYCCKPHHICELNKISNSLGCGNVSVCKISETNYTLVEEI